MPAAFVEYSSRAVRDLRRPRCAHASELLSKPSPATLPIWTYGHSLAPGADYRLRVGDWRVVFSWPEHAGAKGPLIERIAHRREIYRS